jgi:hypothetical protein
MITTINAKYIAVVFSKFWLYRKDLARLYAKKMTKLNIFPPKNASLSLHKMQHILGNLDRHQFFHSNISNQPKAIPIASIT